MANMQKMPQLIWALPGFLIQMGGLLSGHPVTALIGTVPLVAGLAYYIKAKGYSAAWGLWGVVPIMGVIILAMQRPHAEVSREEWLDDIILEEDPHIHSFLRKKPAELIGGWKLLLAMAPIGLLLLFFCAYLPHLADSGAEGESAAVDGEGQASRPGEQVADSRAVGGEAPEPDSAPAEEAETPVAVAEAKAEAEATEGVGEERAAAATPAAEAAAEPMELPFAERVAKIQLGMSYAEAAELAGPNATRVAGTTERDKTVHWEGSDGSFIVAKFVDDQLVRRTPLRRGPETRRLERIAEEMFKLAVPDAKFAADEDAEQAEPERDAEAPVTESAQAEAEPAEEPVVAQDDADGAAEEVYIEDEEQEIVEEPQKRSRVVRVGGRSDGRGRATYKKAKLPRYTRPIEHGPHDVHIYNPNPFRVKVAVRSGKRGKNLTLSADDETAIYLRNGRYALYYLDAENPVQITSAGSFTVDSPPTALRISLR